MFSGEKKIWHDLKKMFSINGGFQKNAIDQGERLSEENNALLAQMMRVKDRLGLDLMQTASIPSLLLSQQHKTTLTQLGLVKHAMNTQYTATY